MTPADARQELGVTWAAFAQFTGVSKRQVANWESGARTPSASAQRLIDLLVILHRRGELEDRIKDLSKGVP